MHIKLPKGSLSTAEIIKDNLGHFPDMHVETLSWKSSSIWSSWQPMFLNFHVCSWQTLLSEVTCIALKVYSLSVHAFPVNLTHDLGIASDMLYSFCNVFLICINWPNQTCSGPCPQCLTLGKQCVT